MLFHVTRRGLHTLGHISLGDPLSTLFLSRRHYEVHELVHTRILGGVGQWPNTGIAYPSRWRELGAMLSLALQDCNAIADNEALAMALRHHCNPENVVDRRAIVSTENAMAAHRYSEHRESLPREDTRDLCEPEQALTESNHWRWMIRCLQRDHLHSLTTERLLGLFMLFFVINEMSGPIDQDANSVAYREAILRHGTWFLWPYLVVPLQYRPRPWYIGRLDQANALRKLAEEDRRTLVHDRPEFSLLTYFHLILAERLGHPGDLTTEAIRRAGRMMGSLRPGADLASV